MSPRLPQSRFPGYGAAFERIFGSGVVHEDGKVEVIPLKIGEDLACDLVIDSSMPPTTLEMRDRTGRVVARVENLHVGGLVPHGEPVPPMVPPSEQWARRVNCQLPHSYDPRPEGGAWRCSRCGSELDATAASWYMRGREHEHQHERRESRRLRKAIESALGRGCGCMPVCHCPKVPEEIQEMLEEALG